MAAAVQGKRIFPLRWLIRLVTTQEKLSEEHSLHRWGLEVSPNYYGASGKPPPLKPLSLQERRRNILGHLWVVPDVPTGFEPVEINIKEMEAAPWPLQIEAALKQLYGEIAPKMGAVYEPSLVAYAEKWYTEAFKLPCDTDQQAVLFFKVTATPSHYKSLRVLARWRQIALDPRFPQAAERVASECGEAMRLWGDERAQDIGQAILCDILRGSIYPAVRLQAAWSSKSLLTQFTENGDKKLDPPMQVVVALGDLACDPGSGSEWNRLYGFVNPIFRLLPDAPMREDIDRLEPQSPQVHKLLQVFSVWFREHRAAFVREGQKQIHAMKEIAVVRETKF